MSTGPVAPYPERNDRPLKVILTESGFGRWGRRLPWILFFIAVFIAISNYGKYQRYTQTNPRLEERYVSHSELATNKVAIIRVEGPILHNDGFAKWQIDQVKDDPDVKAIVLRVDSPGGTVTGSDYLYHHLKMLREGERKLPIVVSMGAMAASGGYYIAMAAGNVPDTIFAERTTWTGSIGVIIPHFNIADLLEKWDIKDDSIASGPLKELGSPTRKLPPAMAEKERAILQGMVDQTFDQFKQIVSEARPNLAANKEAFEKATTGQVFTATQALELGLVDQIGYLEEAVDRAIKLANLDSKSVRVVKYVEQKGLFGTMLSGPSEHSGNFDIASLLELTTPKAYYVYTSLPAILTTRR
jgi:protease-4